MTGGTPRRLDLISVDDGSTVPLIAPQSPRVEYDMGVLSPDEKQLAFIRNEGEDVRLGVVKLTEGFKPVGEPPLLASDHRHVIWPLWSKDGKDILYVDGNRSGRSSMWRISTVGGSPRRISTAGDGAWVFDLARQVDRMAFTRMQSNTDLAL